MRVSTDLYLYHTPRLLLRKFFGPPPVKECNFTFIFVFIVVFSIYRTLRGPLDHCPQNDFFSCTYLAYKFLQTRTYITCSQVRPLQHTHTLSWPLSESHLSLCASAAPTHEPLLRFILCMYWYVWEPFAPSILCEWPLDHYPPSRHGASLVPPQSVDHTGVLFKIFSDSLKQWKYSRAQLLPFVLTKL